MAFLESHIENVEIPTYSHCTAEGVTDTCSTKGHVCLFHKSESSLLRIGFIDLLANLNQTKPVSELAAETKVTPKVALYCASCFPFP